MTQTEQFSCSCGYIFQEEDINFKLKIANCPYCRAVSRIPRQKLNSNTDVVTSVEMAVKAFEEKDYNRSKGSADYALQVGEDSAPALFISAYYDAFYASSRDGKRLYAFFKQKLQELDLEIEEVEQLKRLFIAGEFRIAEFEEQIFEMLIPRQTPEELVAFAEAFCPRVILKRTNVNWFTPKMIDLYCQLSAICNIPKTWFSLYKLIAENPDSPEKNNEFFLKKKVERFYNGYVLGVEKVYNSIKDSEQKTKFTTAFAAKKQKYVEKMKSF